MKIKHQVSKDEENRVGAEMSASLKWSPAPLDQPIELRTFRKVKFRRIQRLFWEFFTIRQQWPSLLLFSSNGHSLVGQLFNSTWMACNNSNLKHSHTFFSLFPFYDSAGLYRTKGSPTIIIIRLLSFVFFSVYCCCLGPVVGSFSKTKLSVRRCHTVWPGQTLWRGAEGRWTRRSIFPIDRNGMWEETEDESSKTIHITSTFQSTCLLANSLNTTLCINCSWCRILIKELIWWQL